MTDACRSPAVVDMVIYRNGVEIGEESITIKGMSLFRLKMLKQVVTAPR
jgi:hypothetical protein